MARVAEARRVASDAVVPGVAAFGGGGSFALSVAIDAVGGGSRVVFDKPGRDRRHVIVVFDSGSWVLNPLAYSLAQALGKGPLINAD